MHVPAVRIGRAGIAAGGAGGAVRPQAGLAGLQPHVPVAGVDQGGRVIEGLVHGGAGGVQIDRHVPAEPAAEQFVHGHSGALSGDVPERHVHPGQRAVQDRPIPPIRREMQHSAYVGNVGGRAPDDQRRHVCRQDRDNGRETLVEGRATQPIQTVNAGVHPDYDQVHTFRRGDDRPHPGDPHVVPVGPGRAHPATGNRNSALNPSNSRAGARSMGTVRPSNRGLGTPG